MLNETIKQSELLAFLALTFLLITLQVNKQYIENPPIITLSEGDANYRFPSGSNEVSYRYEQKLRTDIIPYLDSLSIKHQCNAIQIIGHTSGKGLSQERFPRSNLDKSLAESLYYEIPLMPGSNVDLGMTRSVAIMKIFQDSQRNGFLTRIKYWFPYSAGQVIKTDGQLLEYEAIFNDKLWDDDERRRVEIRLFRIVEGEQEDRLRK